MRSLISLIVALVTVNIQAVSAHEPNSTPQAAVQQEQTVPTTTVPTTTGSTELRAYIDPETGQLISAPVEPSDNADKPQAVKSDPHSQVKMKRHDDGMVELILGDSMMVDEKAYVACDGSVHSDHQEQQKEAVQCPE